MNVELTLPDSLADQLAARIRLRTARVAVVGLGHIGHITPKRVAELVRSRRFEPTCDPACFRDWRAERNRRPGRAGRRRRPPA
jgi:hypothetical protein